MFIEIIEIKKINKVSLKNKNIEKKLLSKDAKKPLKKGKNEIKKIKNKKKLRTLWIRRKKKS